MKRDKPLGKKCYGSIPHLPCSRMEPSDSSVSPGQARIATIRKRDKHDFIVVQEKLDGSCVGVAKRDGQLIALTKKGYLATSSPFKMHHEFAYYVGRNKIRFDLALQEGERLCGEWMIKAHGTMYDLPHEPFVALDIFREGGERMIFSDFCGRVRTLFTVPRTYLYVDGSAMAVETALDYFGELGFHGAKERIEGAVWRVERKGIVDFLCKYVRPDKVDGKYLEDVNLMNTWTDNVIRGPEAK